MPRIGHRPEDHEDFVARFASSHTEFDRPTQMVEATRDSLKGANQTGMPMLEKTPALDHTYLTRPTILICGHDSRDSRCGRLGPILLAEFQSHIRRDKQESGGFSFKGPQSDAGDKTRIALISHIGGHAFAGNVIIYVPRYSKLSSGWPSPLEGMGIWYGRVEPRHVRGIVDETIERGNIIEDLLRGVHKGKYK